MLPGRLQLSVAAFLAGMALCAWAAPGDLTLISRDQAGNPGNEGSYTYSGSVTHFSADGHYLVFWSNARLTTEDTDRDTDVYVWDRQCGAMKLASPAGRSPHFDSISADGRYVAYDGYVYDRQGATVWIGGYSPSISADGRFVAAVFQDADRIFRIHVVDLQNGAAELVSRAGANGVEADSISEDPAISADGRHVAFHSLASNLNDDDADNLYDIYTYDRQSGIIELISRAGANGVKGNGRSLIPSISTDGRYVAFESQASNLRDEDIDSITDVYVYDQLGGTVELVSRAGATGAKGNNPSFEPSISADGRYVAFTSSATNLAVDDLDNRPDIYIYDRQAGTITLISRRSDGVKANEDSRFPTISPDGALLAFASRATNLQVPETNSGQFHVYVKETGLTAPSPNRLPVANAGADQTVEATDSTGTAVTLDGSASSDPDGCGAALSFAWSGPFGTASGVSPTVTLPVGTHIVSLNVSDGAGAASSDTVTITVQDSTPPSLICPADVTGMVGQAVNLGNPTVSDSADAPVSLRNNGPTNFPAGTTTVTWTAADASGNSASCVQFVTLNYNFQGFFRPLDNPPVVNTVKSGATVPVKWRLLDAAGNYVSDIATVTGMSVTSSTCDGPEDAVAETVPAGGTVLRWDSTTQQFIYDWKTPSLPGQCVRLDLRLSDGTTKSANFKLK